MPSQTEATGSRLDDDIPGTGRYVWRPADGRLDWSFGLVEIYGRKVAPETEAEFMACLHPDDRIRVEGETEAFLTEEADAYSHSFRIVRPDGEIRYLVDRARVHRDGDGRVTEVRGLNVDVTDFRHLAHGHLAHGPLDDDTRPVQTTAPDAVADQARPDIAQSAAGPALADIDYRSGTIRLGAAAARLYGLGEADITVPRADVHATFHPEDRAALEEQIRAALDPGTGGQLVAEHRIQRPDGTVRWLQVRKRVEFGVRDGRRQPDRGILAAIDVTDRRTVEHALRMSEERLSLAQEVAGIGAWDVDLRTGRSVWTAALYDLLQIDRATPVSPEAFFEKVHPDDDAGLRRAFETAIAEKSSFAAEFRVVPQEGVVRHFVGQGRVVDEVDGRAARILGVNYDVTDRKLAETRLRDSEAQLRTILDETVALAGILEPDGTLREANSTALKFGGLARSDVIGRPCWEVPWWTHDPAEVARLKDAVARAASGESVRYDAWVRAADGSVRTIDFSLSPVFGEDGAVSLLVPSALDITDRKLAETKLAEREAQLALFVEHAPAAIAMFDREQRYVAYSRRYITDFRLPGDIDLIGRRNDDVLPDMPGRWHDIHARVLAGESLSAEDEPFPRADGRTDWVRWTMAPWHAADGTVGGALLFSEVVTDQIEGRRALRDSEARYRSLVELMPAAMYTTDAAGRITLFNQQAVAVWGRAPCGDDTEQRFCGAFRLWRPDGAELPHAESPVAVALRTGESFRGQEVVVERPDGSRVAIAANVDPIRDAEGRIVGAVNVFVDITERRQAEERLRSAHDTFHHMVEESPFGIYTVDADFRLVQVSRGARKVFENVRPLIGRDFAEVLRHIWEEPFASEAIGRFRDTLATGKSYHSARTVEQRHDLGGEEAYDWRIERIALPDGRPGVVCHFYDLSERLRHEERVTTLLKEVNHRAKNMLSLVTVIARQTAARGGETFLERFSERIRALATNQDVLVGSEWNSADLEDLIRAQLAHFEDLLDRRIHLEGPPLALIPAVAEKLGMAVHELATNAAKYGALSNDAGRVRITWRTGETGRGPGFVIDWREEDGPAVEPPGRTGFGSMISGKLLASALDGEVDARFLPEGLRWRLSCPLSMVSSAGRTTARAPAAAADLVAADGGGAGVLVVEDDALLAMSVMDMLQDAGLSVIGPAGTVDGALAHLERTRPAFAVLDVNLGTETSERVALRLRRMAVPFLCVSGYSSDQLPGAFRHAPFLPKPVEDAALLGAIRSALS